MRIALTLTLLFGAINCFEQNDTTKSLVYTDENSETRKVHLEVEPNITATVEDILIAFYDKSHTGGSALFKCNDTMAVKKTSFNASRPTVFVIHGWRDSHTSESCQTIKDALVSSHDVNIFAVDWFALSKKNYDIPQSQVVQVGKLVAQFIQLLVKNFGLNLSNVKMIGHCLGAHVAGNAGAALGGAVGVIVGLDPAGPFFFFENSKNRLRPSSARFVEAIHTNSGKLGVRFEVGHADYWPNGGIIQPGCADDDAGTCAHARSYEFYAESLKSNKFVARKCADFKSYKHGLCKNNTSSSMGMYDVNTRATGNYYLRTNPTSPFAKGG